MKLYTESQVKRMMQLARETHVSKGQILLSFEYIKLPSDEEIEQEFTLEAGGNKWRYGHKIEGAKWMRDKIQGDSK